MVGMAWAMHEINHRFTVYGYVRDAQGKPVSDARVIVSAEHLGEGSTAFTDRQGYYETTLHVHDTNLGEPIKVSTGDQTKEITAQFNVQDMTTERRMEVSFGPTASSATPEQYNRVVWYGVGALLVVGVGVAMALYKKKRVAHATRGHQSKKKRGG
jgi:hypothetical protein